MFRFTIRDVLWLMVVVGLSVGWWVNRQQYCELVEKQAEQANVLKRESRIWESRAHSLRSDLTEGTNKNTDVEFIPNGIRYVPKKAGSPTN